MLSGLNILSLLVYIMMFSANSCAYAQEQSIDGVTPYDDVLTKYNTGHLVPKIFNGDLAADGAYPWQVSLIIARIKDPIKGFFCSGSIYNEGWIITAAHCLVRKEPPSDPKGKLVPLTSAQLFIAYGTNSLNADIPNSSVDKIILHKEFNPANFDNDIALLRLSSPLQFGDKVNRIELSSPADEPTILKDGARLTVTGWGSSSAAKEHAKLPERALRFAKLSFVPAKTCEKAISFSSSTKAPTALTSNMICTYSRLDDICTGDSGGPLIPDLSTVKLIGVISGNWAGDCGSEDYQRHTRVSRFYQWIENCTSTPQSCSSWK